MSARAYLTALVAVAAVVAAAGCGGGSGGGTTSTQAAASAMTPAQKKAAITKAWTSFFSSSTAPSEKVNLLQNGQQFASVIKAQSKNPLASHVKAKVTSVTLQGSGKATVVYTVSVAGVPALKNQHGTAVLADGAWKVGDSSFCGILALQGTTPSGCPKKSG